MAMVINSNIMSLTAQRNLGLSQNDMNTSMERLSSGKRINSAADDAAGLGIANRMTSQVRGLEQAIRNANDGISLMQTAEGALDETTNILQRMRELAIQSANGIYSSGNRQTLDAEVQQLISEIDRISETTKFNGLNILDGSLGEVLLQAGEGSYETIALNIGATSTDKLGSGSGASIVGTDLGADLLTAVKNINGGTNTMEINGIDVGDLSSATTMQDVLDQINEKVESITIDSVVTQTATGSGDGVVDATAGTNIAFTLTAADGTPQVYKVNGTSSLEEFAARTEEVSGGAIKASVNSDGFLTISADNALSIGIAATGVTLATVLGTGFDATEYANFTVSSNSGSDGVTIEYKVATDASRTGLDTRLTQGQVSGDVALAATGWNDGDLILNGITIGKYDNTKDYDENGTAGQITDTVAFLNTYSAETGVVASLSSSYTTNALVLTSADGSDISIDYKAGQESTMQGILNIFETNAEEGSGGNIGNISIATADGAQKAIDVIDGALEQINQTRGDIGAVSNRLDFTINNLSNVAENVAAARSRIEDADFARESAALSRAQVLQQAGTAMLAQANAQPQQVLSLLQ